MKKISSLCFALVLLWGVLLFLSFGKTANAEDIIQGSGEDPAYDIIYFTDSKISADQEQISYDRTTESGALLISGENGVLKETSFTFDDPFDFGTDTVDRVELDLLAKKNSNVSFRIYLDHETEPIMESTLSCQADSSSWQRTVPIVVDLSDLHISGSHVIHFQLFDEKTAESKTNAVLLRSIHFVKSSVPVLYLTIDESLGSIQAMNDSANHSAECYGDMAITVPDSWQSPYEQGTEKYTGGSYTLDYIRGRGNSTWDMNKKPYKIKISNSSDLFHMGSNKHWVLLADSYDTTLLRNYFTYHLAESLGLPYSIKSVKVDLYMNQVYYGSYTFCEQVRVDESRVNIDDLTKNYDDNTIDALSLSGGYIIGMANNSQDQTYTFQTKHGEDFTVSAPQSDATFTYTKANQYIESYMQRVECAIYGEANSQGVKENIWDLMDLESTVKYYFIQEFSANSDAYTTSSTYLYKPRDQKNADGNIEEAKLYWGPIWDFDQGWKSPADWDDYQITASEWINHLRTYNPEFIQALKEYWPSFRQEIVKLASDGGYLDQYMTQLLPSAIHNYTLYKDDLTDSPFDDAPSDSFSSSVSSTASSASSVSSSSETKTYSIKEYYQKLITEQKDWILVRLAWFDKNIDNIKMPALTVIYQSEGKTYYTGHESLNSKLSDLPAQNPTNHDSSMVFKGWHFQKYDEESGEWEETELMDSGINIDLQDLKVVEDGYQLTLTAYYEDCREFTYPSNVFFERNQYYVCYDPDTENTLNIFYEIYPQDVSESTLNWSTSNDKIAKVESNDGYVCLEYFSSGDITVNCKTANGKNYTCQVHIYSKEEAIYHTATDMTLDQTNLTLTVGGYKKLNVTLVEEDSILLPDTMLSGLLWTSDNVDVADVSHTGLITTSSVGTANIIVCDKALDVMLSCKVTVKAKPKTAKVGDVFTNGKLKYKVTKLGKNGTVKVIGEAKNYESITIPATVKYLGKSYTVNRIEAKAFYKKSKLKTVIIGKNVSSIGSKAFYKASKLKKITIQTTKLKKSTIGSKAFKHIYYKAKVKVPKSKKKSYKSILKKKGLTGKKQKVS